MGAGSDAEVTNWFTPRCAPRGQLEPCSLPLLPLAAQTTAHGWASASAAPKDEVVVLRPQDYGLQDHGTSRKLDLLATSWGVQGLYAFSQTALGLT